MNKKIAPGEGQEPPDPSPDLEAAAAEAEIVLEEGSAERFRTGGSGPLAVSRLNLDSCIDLIKEGQPAPVMRIMEELERDMIAQALIMTRANIRGAAVLLGLKYTTLYAKIRKHGLRPTKAIRFRRDAPVSKFEGLAR